VVEPGEGAFDDPADGAEPGSVFGVAACDHGFDAALTNEAAVFVVVVAAVSNNAVGSLSGPADLAAHWRHRVEQWDQLGDVVAVATGDREGERDPCGVDQEMVFGSGSAPVHRARARFGAPFFAWM
jgi:hypothetical protein